MQGRCPLTGKGRENVTGNMIVKPSVQQRFDSFMERGRVLFFSAPCGFGKSTLSDALLSGRDVLRLNAGAADFAIPAPSDGWDILLIDDFQMFSPESDGQALCELIRSDPAKRFVLLSRGAPPGYLTAFQYSGLMTTLEADDLLFDREDIRKYFSGCGVAVTDSEIGGILRESVGYPLGIAVTARCMSGGKPFGPEIVARAFREVFSYFEDAIYRRFDLPVRQFLLELAPFERFNPEMARMVTGDPHAGSRLDWLLSHTTMLRYDDMQHFRFWPQFRDFLLWEMAREYSEKKRRALFSRGALYYELKEDYAHALECYTRCGDHAKVSELLVRNAELHPGMGHYSEMEKYYRSLPEAEIAASPALMQGMSMLCALAMDYDGSRRWYQELQEFARRCGKDDAAGKQARSRLAWLDISLPQRGVEGLTETIPAVFRLMTNKEVSQKLAVVLTERMRPELMTCEDIVATGRYPYTGTLGILSAEDKTKVKKSMETVHAWDLKDRDFTAISDGQRQRILLARAICQEPEIIVLDEPTSFLDIRHKLELLTILKQMVLDHQLTVIMSLHELDLAQKISDKVICVHGEYIEKYGAPEEIFTSEYIRKLYGITRGSYNAAFGCVEMDPPRGEPQVFVIGGNGSGIPYYRKLQRQGIPFAAGVLHTNDVDCQVAGALADQVITEKPFESISQESYDKAVELMKKCQKVICPLKDFGTVNAANRELLRLARELGILAEL